MITRLAALVGMVLGLVGLGIDYVEMVPFSMAVSEANPVARSFPGALVWYLSYFTHLTNLGLVLVYIAALTGWGWLAWFRRPQTQAMMGGYMLLVMLYYHFTLSGLYVLEANMQLATFILHYATPLFFLGWWAIFTPHGALRFRDVPWMLVPGLLYAAWALLRGAVVNEYPYEILNPGTLGYGGVAIGVGMIVVAVAVFCAVLVAVDGLLARLKTARS